VGENSEIETVVGRGTRKGAVRENESVRLLNSSKQKNAQTTRPRREKKGKSSKREKTEKGNKIYPNKHFPHTAVALPCPETVFSWVPLKSQLESIELLHTAAGIVLANLGFVAMVKTLREAGSAAGRAVMSLESRCNSVRTLYEESVDGRAPVNVLNERSNVVSVEANAEVKMVVRGVEIFCVLMIRVWRGRLKRLEGTV